MKYSQWLDIWLENYVKPTSKIKTYTIYKQIVEKRLKPRLGEYELNEISPVILQCYVTELLRQGNAITGAGLSANTVNGIITVIQNFLKLACMIGESEKYIADKIKRPKISEKEVSCFTVTEQKKIERAVLADKRQKMFGIVLCLYTGLRIGELLALMWKDIDFIKGVLSVNKTIHDGNDENGHFCSIIGVPKTQSSMRNIPLPKQLIPLLQKLKKHSDSEYVISDKGKGISINVTWYNYYDFHFADKTVDYFVHCASPTKSNIFIEQPVETIDAIYSETKRMLDAFRCCDGRGFLYVSSVEVYGDNHTMNLIDETNCGSADSLKIRNCYPIAKRMAENLCMSYASEYGLPIKIARLSQIIGVGASDNRLIAYLCRSAIDKSQIVLHSDGKTTKSYCYIMDCISAMIYILVKGESTAYNVSNPDAVASVYDLAKFVSNKYIGLPVVLENKALDMYPISSCLILDSKKLSKLGWAPKVGIEEAFNRLINLMKE